MKKQSNHTAISKRDDEKVKKASDSDKSNLEITESDEEIFIKEDFEDALRRVSRRISEPDEETT